MFGGKDFTLFGVSWILVGTIGVALIRRYVKKVPGEGVQLGAALWMCLGYFLDKTVSGETFVFPTTPTGWLTLGLSIFIYFGTIMGLAPGDTAGKVYHGIKYRILGR